MMSSPMADCQISYSGRREKRADMEAVQVLLVNPIVELVLVLLDHWFPQERMETEK